MVPTRVTSFIRSRGAAFLIVALSGLVACADQPLPTDPQRPNLVLLSVGSVSQVSVGAGGVTLNSGLACVVRTDGRLACWGDNDSGAATPPTGTFRQVSVGYQACAVRTDDTLVCWGDNEYGRATPPGGTFTQVSSGAEHNCAVKSDGTVACWGNNTYGQATPPSGSFSQVSAGGGQVSGDGYTCGLRTDGTLACWGSANQGQATPPSGTFSEVSAGGTHTCGVKTDGTVACWGNNTNGQATPPSGTFRQVSAGSSHTCGVKTDGTVVCWGYTFFFGGPVPPPSGTFTQVSAGGSDTCGLTTDGTVVCWASDYYGLPTPPNETYIQVSASGDWTPYTCGVTTQGTVVCWGDNDFSKADPLGDDPQGEIRNSTFSQVSAGNSHACGVKADGTVICWGSDDEGQGMAPSGTFSQVSAGSVYTCGVKTDATVACWGGNGYTLLGPPPSGTFSQISAGDLHTCGVKTDGTVACWGLNDHGQATAPSGTFSQVSAGGYLISGQGSYTCGVKTDGTVACWGYNGSGQATPPSGTFSQVDAGGAHTCGVTTQGTLTCWGDNPNGQATPPSGTFTQVTAGYGHSCALEADQSVICWGRSAIAQSPDPGSTPSGANVSVNPVDQTTGTPSPVQLSFETVTGGGTTTVTSSAVGQGSSPPPPQSFRLGSPPTFYDIETSATYSGAITICVDYGSVSYGNENNLKLLHYEAGSWQDVTISLNTTSNQICGTVTSLSPFLAAESNLAPVVTALTLPVAPIPVGQSVGIAAGFTDQNPLDAHTASINWDDGLAATDGVITEASGAGSVTGLRTYAGAGVYTISVAVSDGLLAGLRSSVSDVPAYLVVYDPSAGFVTGGGWIDSPNGACLWTGCASDGGTIGKATFGFVSRYQKGANAPTGSTEFQFNAGGLNFSSTSYQWLVVSGSRAHYKGEGSINGAGSYGFLLTAIDGALSGSGGADRFRIKLWDKATGAVVYDNEIGQSEDSPAATVLGGGSIVIHK